MMSIYLAKLLRADAQARLLTYRNEYMFDGVEYAPLMYKIIMRLATIDSVATTQTLRNNLQSLETYASEVQNEMIIIGHQILSCHVLVVRSFFILKKILLSS